MQVVGRKAIGDNSGSVFPPFYEFLGIPAEAAGLQNPRGAEIHLLMHSHGPKIPELMPAMIHTFAGGCQDPGPPFAPLMFPEWGPVGPNSCVTEQASIHLSPEAP